MSVFDWMADARCAQVDPALWTGETRGDTYRDARTICQRCPVRPQCDAHAEHLRQQPDTELRGMWAGRTPTQRRKGVAA